MHRFSAIVGALAAACLAVSLPAPAAAEQAKVGPAPSPAWPFRAATAKPKELAAGGIGLMLELRPEGVFAQGLVPGGPAQRAGVQAGDQIVRADQWTVPAGAKVPEVAEHIRGTPGTNVELGCKRGGADVVFTISRVAMNRLFPEQSKEVMAVRKGFALAATGAGNALGLRFGQDGKAGELLTYEWAAAAPNSALGVADAKRGQGAVTVGQAEGAVVQVADWRIDLRAQPDGTVMIAASSLPVHEVVGDWLAVAPPYPTLVKPRASAAKKAQRWAGSGVLKLQLMADGKPLAKRRATFSLADAGAQAMDTRTVVTDANGVAEVAVPKGLYRLRGLAASAGGAGSDVFVTHVAVADDRPMETDKAAPVAITLQPKPASAAPQLDWGGDPRVGQGLPLIDVQRWFHLDKAPASLAGKVLLIDVWATWCGPCKATAPLVAELHSRLAAKGLVVVALSIDKDETAIEEYAKEQLPGSVPIAWAGPDAMETLDTESVPTFFVVDGKGQIRAFHKGMGWDIGSLQPFLESLLSEKR